MSKTTLNDGRGDYMKNVSKKIREKIIKFVAENPDANKKQCCEHVGISYLTLRKHLKEIELINQ